MNLKSLKWLAVIGSFGIPCLVTAQTVAERPPMREAPTNEQLIQQMRMADQERAKRPVSDAPPSQDPSTLERPADLISRAEILCYGGALTLVPKRAVLQYPEKYADRLKAVQGVKIISFPDFYAANRNWITTFEVSRAQAEGKEPLPKDAKANMVKSGSMVVATFLGNPISVLPVITEDQATAKLQDPSTAPKP